MTRPMTPSADGARDNLDLELVVVDPQQDRGRDRRRRPIEPDPPRAAGRRLCSTGPSNAAVISAAADSHACRRRRLFVQSGILDHDTRCGSQRDHDLLVLGGELSAATLLGQIEVAEDLVANPDRSAEKGIHRRMVRREAVRGGVAVKILESQRLGVVDDVPEDPVSGGQVADGVALLLAEPVRDELLQPSVRARGDHAQSDVLRIDQSARRLDDLLEDPLQATDPRRSRRLRREALESAPDCRGRCRRAAGALAAARPDGPAPEATAPRRGRPHARRTRPFRTLLVHPNMANSTVVQRIALSRAKDRPMWSILRGRPGPWSSSSGPRGSVLDQLRATSLGLRARCWLQATRRTHESSSCQKLHRTA